MKTFLALNLAQLFRRHIIAILINELDELVLRQLELEEKTG